MDIKQDGSLCDICFEMKLKTKAETICNTCDIRLCKECAGHHITNKISFRHDVVPFIFHETLDVVLSCKKHDEQLCNIYCDQCETSICLKCLSSGLHKDHSIQTLSEACYLKQEYIRKESENLKSKLLPAYRFALQEIENLISKVTIAHKQRQSAIDELEKEFHKIADGIVSKYRTEAKTAEEKDINPLHTLKDEYQNKISSINEVLKEFEGLFSSKVPTGILSYSSRNTLLEVPEKLKIVIDVPDFHPKFLSKDEFCKLIGCLPSSSIDIREEKICAPTMICSPDIDVKDSVRVLGVSAAQMRCVLERFHNDLKFLSVPSKTLKTEGFFKSSKVYVEYSGEEDTTHFTHTHFFRLLDRHQNTIRIHVNLPSTSDVENFLKSNSRHEQLLKNAITKSREDSSSSLEIRSKNGSDSLDEGISDRGSEIDFKLKTADGQDKLVEYGESVSDQNWDSDFDNDVTIIKEEDSKRYFHIVNNVLDLLTKQRNLTVLVDKRITLGAFKKELEPHVGTSSDNFKVYRVYSNNQEFENIRLTETLSFFEDGQLNIKLGRALKQG